MLPTEGMEKFFPAEKIMITGNPVRNIFSENNIRRSEALKFFGLKPEFKTVLLWVEALEQKVSMKPLTKI